MELGPGTTVAVVHGRVACVLATFVSTFGCVQGVTDEGKEATEL